MKRINIIIGLLKRFSDIYRKEKGKELGSMNIHFSMENLLLCGIILLRMLMKLGSQEDINLFKSYLVYKRLVYLIFLCLIVVGGNLLLGTQIDINSFVLISIIYFYYYLTDFLERNKRGVDLWISSTGIYILLFIILWSFSKSGVLIYKFFLLWLCGNILRVIIFQGQEDEEQLVFLGEKNEYKNFYKVTENKPLYLKEEEIFKVKKMVEENQNLHIILANNISMKYKSEMLKLKVEGRRVSFGWQYLEDIKKKIDVRSIKEEWFLETHGFIILHDGFQKKLKRLMDVTLSLILIMTTWPIMIISCIIIKVESRGKVIFSQERTGLRERNFKLLKFRSMREGSEASGPRWSGKDDKRVTRYGKIMRKTRIDELPQVWNILKGEMSFVGPRPERPFFIEKLEQEIPHYALRHCIKPGLTGWAQVMYPYGASIEDSLHKLEYDLYYIKHQDVVLDTVILFKTIKIVVFGRGR